jgi:hypothetical protein
MSNTAAEAGCMHEEWKVLEDNKTHRQAGSQEVLL